VLSGLQRGLQINFNSLIPFECKKKVRNGEREEEEGELKEASQVAV